MSKLRPSSGLLCLFACLSACGAPVNDPPFFDESRCPFRLDPSQVPGKTVRCGNLNVPENRLVSHSARILVPVLVFKSPNPSAPAAINLAGGPGQSWADLGLDQFTAADNATFKRDQIFIEQRGTGLSRPNLDCPELDPTSMDNMGANMDPLMACQQRLMQMGVNLAAYNTRTLAADVEDARATLGHPKVFINGTSYGTEWGLAILRDYPEGLQGAIIDSILAPQDPPLRSQSSGRDSALTALFSACRADSMCNSKFPDLDNKLTQTIAALEKKPLSWSLAPNNQLTPDVYVSLVDEVQLEEPGFVPFLIEAVSDALTTGQNSLDQADARIQMLLMNTMTATASLAIGQFLSVDCADNQLATMADVQADLAKVRPALRPYLQDTVLGELQLCQAWTYQHWPQSAFAPVVSSVPALLLSGALDNRTPPMWAMDAAKTLSNGTLLSFPGLSHDVQGADSMVAQACVGTVLKQFVNTGKVADKSCVAQVTPQWVLQ